MFYIHFPSNLTEEEHMLQAKYQKLKKKKKALQLMKAPKQEPEKPALKRPTDARDAREVARKQIKSGAIPAIQKQQTKQNQTSFKRPKVRNANAWCRRHRWQHINRFHQPKTMWPKSL